MRMRPCWRKKPFCVEMATESDFDIDEVLDWDKRDYPSKDLEFDQLPDLDLASDVSHPAPSQSTSQATSGATQETLVLANQLLQSQHNANSLPSQKQGPAIVGMPQMPSSSGLLNPVFPVGGPMISDIRQELMHSHTIGRSGTPPTPTFPSENFDLPPITPPASTGNLSAGFQSLGHSVISARMTGHLMSSGQAGPRQAASRIMQSFGQPNLVSSVRNIQMTHHPQTMPTSVGNMPLTQSLGASEESMEEGSIEKLLDEIVERDMPQGVSEPIMFTSQVPEHSNTTPNTALQVNPQQMQAKALQSTLVPKTMASSTMVHHASMHLTSSPQSPASMGLMNNPHNQNPGSPVAPARTPSPNVQVHQIRQGGQPAKLPTSQMPVSSSIGLSQPSLNTVRSSTGQSTSSQMTQPSNQASERLSPALQSVQMSVPNRSTQNVTPLPGQAKVQATAPITSANKVNWKVIQGVGGVLPIKLHQGNAQTLQGIKLGPTIKDPAILQQIMRAVAPRMPSGGIPVSSTQTSAASTSQGNQKLICYVMPPNSAAAGTLANQTGQKVSGAPANPVKMFFINADKTLIQSKPQTTLTQSVSTSIASRIQLPLGMTTQAQLTKDKLATQSAQADTKDNSSNLQYTQDKTPFVHTVGQQISAVTSNPAQGTSQTKQQVQSAPPIGAHSNPVMTTAPIGSSRPTLTSTASTSVTGKVVPITFVNEATIGRVVAFTPTVTTVYPISTAHSSTTVVAASSTQVTPSAVVNTQLSVTHDNSDDDDSKPLAQVAQTLKKTRKKGTKRKKKSKEAEDTSKTHSAYQIFFKETQVAIRQQKPTAQFDEIAKIVSHMWDKLSEDEKKMYANKARIEHQKAVEETKAQNVPEQQGAPPKQRKTEIPGSAPALGESQRVPPSNGSPAPMPQSTTETVSSTTPTVVAGKATTVVLPGTKSKKTGSTDGSLKSKKKSKMSINPISQRLCVREGCSMPARTTKDRGTQYCSNECIVKHCSMVFKNWVEQRKAEAQVA